MTLNINSSRVCVIRVCFIVMTLSSVHLWSQDNQDAALRKSLQTELENLRVKRDQIIAQRWTAREVASRKRAGIEEKIEAKKEDLDLVASEKSRILDEYRGVQSEMEALRQKREQHRAKFLRLSDQMTKIESFKQLRRQGPRINEAARLQEINKVAKQIQMQKDSPELVWMSLQQLAMKELSYLSQIETQNREIIRDAKTQMGHLVRVGGITAFSTDAAYGQGQALLMSKQKNRLSLSWRSDLDSESQTLISEFVQSTAKKQPGYFWAPFDVLQSPGILTSEQNREDNGVLKWVGSLFVNGGPVAYPIAAIFLIALVMCLERWLTWFRNSRFQGRKIDEFFKVVDEGDSAGIEQYIHQHFPGALGRVFKEIHAKRSQPRENIETLVEEALLHEIPHLERRLNTISVLGGAAPLLGLLGTVYGMIVLFDQITLHGTSDPKLLAGGISIALVTTQMGLAVAIPVQLAQNFVSNRMERLIIEIEKNSVRLMNHLWAKKG